MKSILRNEVWRVLRNAHCGGRTFLIENQQGIIVAETDSVENDSRYATPRGASLNAERISALPDMFRVLAELYEDKGIWWNLSQEIRERIVYALNKASAGQEEFNIETFVD